ncbi:MAG: DUF126 domain-containing protein [Phyllobacteriaceae bacterium]|nr:DUF126 domain-containing protein [Phyllobacteriaceae bacterium]
MTSGEVLVPGLPGAGEALVLTAPISFWGGVDPRTGLIIDVRHPERGASIADKVLFIPATIGSSTASTILLELVHRGKAPAAIVLDKPDAILLLGLVAAREMGWPTPVAVRLEKERFAIYAEKTVRIGDNGIIAIDGE